MGHLYNYKQNRLFMLLIAWLCSIGAFAIDNVTFDVLNSWGGSQYSSYFGKTVNVTITNKTFNAGEWTGVVFPFNASKAQLDETFGENGYTIEEYSSIDGNTINFTIMQTPTVVAGTPYIMKVNTTIGNPSFNGVSFASNISDSWIDKSIDTDLSIRSHYFKIWTYQYVNGQGSPTNAWTISPLGGLYNYLAGEVPFNNNGHSGAECFFFSSTKGNVKLTLNLEKPSGDDDITIEPTTLEGKIALHRQLTDVPTIYLTIPLDDIYGGTDSWGKEQNADGTDKYRRATIQVVDKSGNLEEFTDEGLSIKVRGNSTASVGNGKRPYRLKFDKDVKDANGNVTETHKHDLLGAGYKKRNWTLLANAFDNSMMRNAVTYHIGKYVGMPFCPGYKFVDLVINNEYRGTYQVSDQVEVGKNRVDINEDTDWFLEGVAWTTMVEEPNTTDGEPYFCIKNPEPATEAETAALVQEVTNWRANWLNSFNNGTWQDYNDLESLVKYYIAINLTGDLDGWFVFKGYRSPTGPFIWGPLWDKDLAFGNHGDAKDNLLVENYSKCNFEWKIQALHNDKVFMSAVKTKLDKLISEGLYDKLVNDIDNIAEDIDQTQALNFTKYNINDASWAKVHFPTYPEYVTQLKEWIGLRINTVKTNVDELFTACGGEIIQPVIHQQLTDVPTIYITSSSMNADTWDATANMEVFDKNNMIGGNKVLSAGAVSVKFKSDGTAAKPSYRLKFAAKTPFLGTKSGNYKQWVLEANDDDPTMLRNALTKELGDQMGFTFTPGYQFADVYVNDKYMGTYQITDRVKVESGRVLASDKDTDWLVEIASSGEVDTRTDGNGDLYVAGDTNTPYLIIKNPDKDDLTTDQQTALANEVGTYFNTTFWNNIKDNVDQTSFINWYISTEILAAYKQLSSTYTYKSATDGKLFFGPLSGNEKAYDNNSKYPMDMTDLNTNGSYNGMIFTRADYGVMRNKLQDLWKEDWFKEAVLAKWNSIYGAKASTDVKAALKSKLTALSSEIAQTKAYNYKTTAEGGAGWTLEGSYEDQVSAISTYIDNRFAYLDKKFNELANAEDILMGDANGDGLINITDIVITVDYSLSNPSEAFHFKNADMNGDGIINITDVVQITDIILNAD